MSHDRTELLKAIYRCLCFHKGRNFKLNHYFKLYYLQNTSQPSVGSPTSTCPVFFLCFYKLLNIKNTSPAMLLIHLCGIYTSHTVKIMYFNNICSNINILINEPLASNMLSLISFRTHTMLLFLFEHQYIPWKIIPSMCKLSVKKVFCTLKWNFKNFLSGFKI